MQARHLYACQGEPLPYFNLPFAASFAFGSALQTPIKCSCGPRQVSFACAGIILHKPVTSQQLSKYASQTVLIPLAASLISSSSSRHTFDHYHGVWILVALLQGTLDKSDISTHLQVNSYYIPSRLLHNATLHSFALCQTCLGHPHLRAPVA